MGQGSLVGVAALGVGAVMVTLGIALTVDWDLNALLCASGAEVSTTFCQAAWWTNVVEYLPALLFLSQIVVLIVMSSPIAFIRA